LKFCCS